MPYERMSSRPSPLKSPTIGFVMPCVVAVVAVVGVVAGVAVVAVVAKRGTASSQSAEVPIEGTPRDRATASGPATTLALRLCVAGVASAPVATTPASTTTMPHDMNNGQSLMARPPPQQSDAIRRND